jgi:type VII secretion protein EccE
MSTTSLSDEATLRYAQRAPGSGRVRAPRRRSGIRLGQIVVAELALVVVIASAAGPHWVFAAVAAVAAAVIVATFGRTGGRWWYQAVAYRRRFAARSRRAATSAVSATVAPGATQTAIGWLRALAPQLQLRTVTVREIPVGVGSDEAGWFGAVALEAGTGLSAGRHRDVPLETLATLVGPYSDTAAGQPEQAGSTVSCAQLVLHVVSAPDGGLDPASPVAASYAQLSGSGRHAAHCSTWVAVRLSPVDALALRREPAEIDQLVAAAVLRAARLLRVQGFDARVLDGAGLAAALVEASALDGTPHEGWASWRSGTLAQVCYGVARWPAGLSLVELADRIRGVGTVAVARQPPGQSFGPASGAAPTHVLLRLAAEPAAINRVCKEVTRAVAQLGVRLRRLDGEHGLGAYACAPSGVPAAELIGRSVAVTPAVAGTTGVREGLLLGRDASHEPVALRIFRPGPTRLAAVGGWWLARLLVFRALAVGARIVVRTAYPREWTALSETVTGVTGRLYVVPADRPMTLAGSAHAPVLHLDDLGPDATGDTPPPLGPWQTRLTLMPQFAAHGFATLAAADAVVMQRLGAEEAAAAGAVLRLSEETLRLIQVMHDDMLAVLGGGADRYVWTSPTPVEESVLGAARRGA